MSYHRCDVPEHDELEAERKAVLSLLDDEEWHVGGAWGDYGEPVVLVRNVKERMGCQFEDAVPSSDYAANYAEAVSAAVAAEQRVAELEAERQAVIDAVNLYGDEVLHNALDAIGFAPRAQ